MVKRKTWKGGPRSSRSYTMDRYRQSSESHELRTKRKGHVRPHYRKKKKGTGYSKVNAHKRRASRCIRRSKRKY